MLISTRGRPNCFHTSSVSRRAALSGAIVAHCGLGVDVAGTIQDMHGIISVEQHVVPRPPGQYRRLNKADRLSLAEACGAFIASTSALDPLWKQLEKDASH